MAKEVDDSVLRINCSRGETEVTIIRGHYENDDGSTFGNFKKLYCPYYEIGPFGGRNCQRGGKCGIAEGG